MKIVRNLLLLALATVPTAALAQFGPPPPPTTARAAAPVDLTGQWVSIVTEDWRWRMVTPPKGALESLPLNPDGRAAAMAWSLAADNAAGDAGRCKAFGVGGITRQPGRMRIGWTDDGTLKVDYDAGKQTRTLPFVSTRPGGLTPQLTHGAPKGPPSLQGESKAQWFRQPQSRGLGFGAAVPPDGGALRVVTTNTTGGYLRKNGAPYSSEAVITEQWNRFTGLEGDEWLVILTIVDDPKYLNGQFITSTNFKKESSPSKWNPQACNTPPPLQPAP